MRTSKRDRIITGALELAHRDGFDTLTFDALAEHVGLTRGGVIYHFRTKTDLLEGIAAAFLERWRAAALEVMGKPLEEASRFATTSRAPALPEALTPNESWLGRGGLDRKIEIIIRGVAADIGQSS